MGITVLMQELNSLGEKEHTPHLGSLSPIYILSSLFFYSSHLDFPFPYYIQK